MTIVSKARRAFCGGFLLCTAGAFAACQRNVCDMTPDGSVWLTVARLSWAEAKFHGLHGRYGELVEMTNLFDGLAAYREVLTSPDEGPIKIAGDLNIDAYDFSAKLLDAFAEIASVVHLSRQGAAAFRPIPCSPLLKTPDFICQWAGIETAVEVKNLRAHDFIEKVMLDLYLDAGLKSGHELKRSLVMQRSDRGWLSKDDVVELRALVQRLSECAAGHVHRGTLRSGKAFAFRLEEGGDSRAEDAITVEDLAQDDAFRDGLSKKVTRVTTEALDQLLSPSVKHAGRRVVAMRWDIPWYGILQPADLPEAVRQAISLALSGAPQPVEAIFFNDFSEPLTIYPG